MSQTCETVQIKGEPSEGNPSGIVVINECDFDPATMTKLQEQENLSPEAAKAPEAEKAPEADSAKKPTKVVAPWASK
jgi:hypothetical protein